VSGCLQAYRNQREAGSESPCALRPVHIEAIDLIVELREEAGVSSTNPHVFARNNYQSPNPVCACEMMRIATAAADLRFPELVRSTRLRKHIATHSQLMHLSRHELEQLATFMGHTLDIHLDFYRLPSDVVQIAKVSKILLAVEEGAHLRVHGQTLDDVEIKHVEKGGSSTTPTHPQSHSPEEDPENTTAFDALHTIQSSQSSSSRARRGEDKENKDPTYEPFLDEAVTSSEGEKESTVSSTTQKKRKRNWSAWSSQEKNDVITYFSMNLDQDVIPGKVACLNFIAEYNSSRDWLSVKNCVRNIMRKKNHNTKH